MTSAESQKAKKKSHIYILGLLISLRHFATTKQLKSGVGDRGKGSEGGQDHLKQTQWGKIANV